MHCVFGGGWRAPQALPDLVFCDGVGLWAQLAAADPVGEPRNRLLGLVAAPQCARFQGFWGFLVCGASLERVSGPLKGPVGGQGVREFCSGSRSVAPLAPINPATVCFAVGVLSKWSNHMSVPSVENPPLRLGWGPQRPPSWCTARAPPRGCPSGRGGPRCFGTGEWVGVQGPSPRSWPRSRPLRVRPGGIARIRRHLPAAPSRARAAAAWRRPGRRFGAGASPTPHHPPTGPEGEVWGQGPGGIARIRWRLPAAPPRARASAARRRPVRRFAGGGLPHPSPPARRARGQGRGAGPRGHSTDSVAPSSCPTPCVSLGSPAPNGEAVCGRGPPPPNTNPSQGPRTR